MPNSEPEILLDMTDVRLVLEEALRLVDANDSKRLQADYRDGRPTRGTSPTAAAIQRDLLRLRDLCTLGAGEAGMLFWQFKDVPDPRFPEPS